MRWGLTGGIGSGKSTVCQLLHQRGITTIDADAISRASTAPQGAAIPALQEAFGSNILRPDGGLDRIAMRHRMLQDPPAKAKLESIIHPLVQSAMLQQCQDAENNGARCVVFDIPLLAESHYWRTRFDRIWVIDCSPAIQVTRIMQRNHWSADEAQQLIAAQITRSERLAMADVVLVNEGISLMELTQKVDEICTQFGL